MKEFLLGQAEKMILMRLAIVRILLYTLWSMGCSWQSCMANVLWGNLTMSEKINIFVAMFVNWSTVMLAFLDRTISRISSGQNPLTVDERRDLAKETT